MTAETRRLKREGRKLERKERKVAFNKFMEAVTVFKDLNLDSGLPYKQKFEKVWPAVKPTLEFFVILKITREKFDQAAQNIIVLGDSMIGKEITDEQEKEFLNQLTSIWSVIETVLESVKIAANDKTDEVINKIIEIGEWLFEK